MQLMGEAMLKRCPLEVSHLLLNCYNLCHNIIFWIHEISSFVTQYVDPFDKYKALCNERVLVMECPVCLGLVTDGKLTSSDMNVAEVSSSVFCKKETLPPIHRLASVQMRD